MFALLTALAVSAAALSGSEFVARIRDADLQAREAAILHAVDEGHVPEFWRRFVPVRMGDIELNVAPDYFAIGTDDDYFLAPVTPGTAQKIADKFDCVLPTRKMVDAIYAAGEVKLEPAPMPPSAKMTTVAVFAEHNGTVAKQRGAANAKLGALIAGHKKDIVITPKLVQSPGKVAIYGWHRAEGKPIQPLYLGHTEKWVDYSHGARLIQNGAKIRGRATTVRELLASVQHAALLSDDGPIANARYEARAMEFPEQTTEGRFDGGVRYVINAPIEMDAANPTLLILYALPNGNTIEQTVGRKTTAAGDYRYDIQHIGAQTRWLRGALRNRNIVVAYLECEGLAWPPWRRKHDPENRRIPEMVQELRKRVGGHHLRLVVTGHSGGGSFTFGVIEGLHEIPDDIERIAFLDSNYAYSAERGHAAKLSSWLQNSQARFLCVFAYKDFIARLDNKPFVSEDGGTWGRSMAMLKGLAGRFALAEKRTGPWRRHRALDGRIQFHLHENPDAKILHTVQVERNGFIHAILAGTELENIGYTYFGERAYSDLIGDF